MSRVTTVLFRSRILGFVPGWLALILVLGGTAAATAPVFNGSLAIVPGGQITSSGAPTYPIVNLNVTGSSATTTSAYPYNFIYINGDNVNDNVANGDLVRGFAVQQNTYGANVAGSRRAGYFEQDLTSTIATGINNDYVGVQGTAYSPTAQTSPNPNLIGMFGKAQAANGGTGMKSVVGAEIDAEVDTGASSVYRWGVSTVSLGNVNGSSSDSAFEIGASGTSNPGWLNGLLLDNIHGQPPLAITGCVICTDGSADTVAKGIDLSAYTITGNALKFKNGYWDGSGDIVLPGVLEVGAGKTIQSQSGSLLVNSGSTAGTVALNYNSGGAANEIFYGGGTVAQQTFNSSGITLGSSESITGASLTVSASSGNLLLGTSSGGNLGLNYNVGGSATVVVYDGGTTQAATINNGGVAVKEGVFTAPNGLSTSCAGGYTFANGIMVITGSGAPTCTAPVSSMYLRSDGASGTHIYISQGSGTWTAISGV